MLSDWWWGLDQTDCIRAYPSTSFACSSAAKDLGSRRFLADRRRASSASPSSGSSCTGSDPCLRARAHYAAATNRARSSIYDTRVGIQEEGPTMMTLPRLTRVLAISITLMGCAAGSVEQSGLDRTILPIQPPAQEPITEMDARNATEAAHLRGRGSGDGAPNIVVVLIDDIGFGATETFGGPIETPTFERLANEGLRFNRFHTTALCSPTRAALLSGRNHHNVNVGSVMEIATGFPGNQGIRPDDAKYVAETLRQNGYSTAAFGKWHETATWEVSVSGPHFRWPTHSGFDKFYGFIGGETNQWEPVIFDGVTRVPRPDDDDYHFTTDMTNNAIQLGHVPAGDDARQAVLHLLRHGRDARAAPRAASEWIEKYDGQFDDGWQKLREETFARQKSDGRHPAERKARAHAVRTSRTGRALSPDEKALFALQMETFAGFAEPHRPRGRAIGLRDRRDRRARQHALHLHHGRQRIERRRRVSRAPTTSWCTSTASSMRRRSRACWHGRMTGAVRTPFPHMSAAWAVATDAPFTWTKQTAGDFGGTRNGMVMHWPGGLLGQGRSAGPMAPRQRRCRDAARGRQACRSPRWSTAFPRSRWMA